MAKILLDQYHIDIHAIDKLTTSDRNKIKETFRDLKWIEMLLQFQLDTTLRKKIQITITK